MSIFTPSIPWAFSLHHLEINFSLILVIWESYPYFKNLLHEVLPDVGGSSAFSCLWALARHALPLLRAAFYYWLSSNVSCSVYPSGLFKPFAQGPDPQWNYPRLEVPLEMLEGPREVCWVVQLEPNGRKQQNFTAFLEPNKITRSVNRKEIESCKNGNNLM